MNLLAIIIVLLLLIAIIIAVIYTNKRSSTIIESYTGKFPSGKTIQLVNNSDGIYFTYLTIVDSLNNSYIVPPSSYINGYDSSNTDPSEYHPIYQWDKNHPIQLRLPTILPFGFVGIQAGMHDPNANDDLYSVGLHVRLLCDANGELVYLYSGNTRPYDITVTIPSTIINPISPTVDSFPVTTTFSPNEFNQNWPSSIRIQYPVNTVTKLYVNNSIGDIYLDTINKKRYFHNEVNKYMPTAPITIDMSHNQILLDTSTIPIGEYINLYLYANNDNHCLTFYHDGKYIDPLVFHSRRADISLQITYQYVNNMTVTMTTPDYTTLFANLKPTPVATVKIPLCTDPENCVGGYYYPPIVRLPSNPPLPSSDVPQSLLAFGPLCNQFCQYVQNTTTGNYDNVNGMDLSYNCNQCVTSDGVYVVDFTNQLPFFPSPDPNVKSVSQDMIYQQPYSYYCPPESYCPPQPICTTGMYCPPLVRKIYDEAMPLICPGTNGVPNKPNSYCL